MGRHRGGRGSKGASVAAAESLREASREPGGLEHSKAHDPDLGGSCAHLREERHHDHSRGGCRGCGKA